MSASKLKAVGVKLPYAQKFFPESVAVESIQMDGAVQPANRTLDGRSFDIKADFFDLKFSKKKGAKQVSAQIFSILYYHSAIFFL